MELKFLSKQQKLEPVENLLFKTYLNSFLKRFEKDFGYIDLANFLVLKDSVTQFNEATDQSRSKHLRIEHMPATLRIAFPQLYYIILIRDSANYLGDNTRDELMHYWFSRIRRGFKVDQTLMPFDYEAGYFATIKRFEDKVLKETKDELFNRPLR